ncbi:hypothetical protein DICA1_F10550 [Diutina catenulata]
MTTPTLNVVIVGAGLGGLSTAIGLARKGHSVTVLEGAHALGEVGAGIQVPPNSVRILKEYGVFDAFNAVVTRPKNIILRRFDTGEPLSRTPLEPDMTENYGNPYLLVHRADYQKILWKAAVDRGIEVKFDARVASIDPKAPSVTLEDGTVYAGDVIVGADGIRSRVRDLAVVTDETVSPTPSTNCAYRATIPRDVMLADPDLAPLMEDVNSNCWIGYRRHIMAYPIRNGELYNMVMSHPGQAPVGVWNMPGDVEEMKQTYRKFDPLCQKLISKITSVLKWTLADLPQLPNWVSPSGKVVIIGDAAHAMLPYLAQGAAQALEDGALLAELLSVGDDIPVALAKWERRRKRRAETIQQGARKNGHIWHLADGEEQEERDNLMKQRDGENPDQWSDSKFQRWLFGWNAFTD